MLIKPLELALMTTVVLIANLLLSPSDATNANDKLDKYYQCNYYEQVHGLYHLEECQ